MKAVPKWLPFVCLLMGSLIIRMARCDDEMVEEDEVTYTIVTRGSSGRPGDPNLVNLFLSALPRNGSKSLGHVITDTRQVAHSNSSHWRIKDVYENGKKFVTLTPQANVDNEVTKRLASDGDGNKFLEDQKYQLKKYSDAKGYFIQRWDVNGSQNPTCLVNGGPGPGKPVSFLYCCYNCKNDKSAFLWKFHPYPFDWKAPFFY